MAASDVSLAKDLTIERLGEHKNRVLSATDGWQVVEAARSSHASEKSEPSVQRKEPGSQDADEVENRDDIIEGSGVAQSGQDGLIKEVVSKERTADGFGEPGDSKEAEEQDGHRLKETDLQDSEVEHKDGSSDAGENNIAGMRTIGNLNL